MPFLIGSDRKTNARSIRSEESAHRRLWGYESGWPGSARRVRRKGSARYPRFLRRQSSRRKAHERAAFRNRPQSGGRPPDGEKIKVPSQGSRLVFPGRFESRSFSACFPIQPHRAFLDFSSVSRYPIQVLLRDLSRSGATMTSELHSANRRHRTAAGPRRDSHPAQATLSGLTSRLILLPTFRSVTRRS